LDLVRITRAEILPTLGQKLGDAREPRRIEFAAVVILEELLALDLALERETQEVTFEPEQFAVQIVELFDQAFDARVVEVNGFHELDELALHFLESPLDALLDLLALLERGETGLL